ncbi:MAG: RNA polymerase-associated factor [Marteilia pararefringens]
MPDVTNGGKPKRDDLICRTQFTNTLPEIPADPMFMQLESQLDDVVRYSQNELETVNHELFTGINMDIPLDLVDPMKYSKTNNMMVQHLNPKDEELLKDEIISSKNSKRSLQHGKSVPWLRRTEYLVSGFNNNSRNDGSFARKNKLLTKGIKTPDRDEQIEIIKASFVKHDIVKHHTKPNVKPVKVHDLLPDIQNWGNSCSLVLFDKNPANDIQHSSEKSRESIIKKALIKGMVDSTTNEQFVAYFVPTEETLKLLETKKYDANLFYYYLNKEYNWNFKDQTSKGFEKYHFFTQRNGGLFYNEIETVIQLGRFKNSDSSERKSTLVVQYNEPDQSELRNIASRKEKMLPCSDEFEQFKDIGSKESVLATDDDQENSIFASIGEVIEDKDIFGSDEE